MHIKHKDILHKTNYILIFFCVLGIERWGKCEPKGGIVKCEPEGGIVKCESESGIV